MKAKERLLFIIKMQPVSRKKCSLIKGKMHFTVKILKKCGLVLDKMQDV